MVHIIHSKHLILDALQAHVKGMQVEVPPKMQREVLVVRSLQTGVQLVQRMLQLQKQY